MTVDEWMKQKNIADYGSHLEPIIRLAFEAGQSDPTVWTCFHCGFQTSDRLKASGHFGDMGEQDPLCVVWVDLDADGRASEIQNVAGQLTEEFEENCRLRTQMEGLEYRLLEFENLLGSRFPKCRNLDDAFNLYDSMEGRALAAEERLKQQTPREIPLPIRTTDRVFGTVVHAQGRCDFVDSIFGQCILGAGHSKNHLMSEDHDG